MRKFVRNERRLQFSLAFAVTMLFAALVVRAWVLNGTDRKLCSVLSAQIALSGATVGQPGTPGYSYFHAHPQELEKARAQNRRFLEQLPCEAKRPPKVRP